MKEFKGVWIPYEILTDIRLNDKEKIVYSMIMYLSKERECTITNSYISELLNVSKVQLSRIINSLKKIERTCEKQIAEELKREPLTRILKK